MNTDKKVIFFFFLHLPATKDEEEGGERGERKWKSDLGVTIFCVGVG